MQGFKRPFALVETPVRATLRRDAPETVRQTLPFTVKLWPVEPAAGPSSETEARLRAERASEQLTIGLLAGVADQADPTVRGYPGRIPLWDYHDDETGEPLPLSGPQSVATRRHSIDYLLLTDDWDVHVQPETQDGQLFVAVANLRVQWFRGSRLRSAGTTLASVDIQLQTRS